MQQMRVPAPPGGLRPGQLGVVMLGRVIMGDMAVTLVDLAIRELVRVEQAPDGGDGGWQLTPLLAGAPRQQRESLLEYEHKLLEGLADCGPASSLPALAAKAAPC